MPKKSTFRWRRRQWMRYIKKPSKQRRRQGDQMSLWKSRPKCVPAHFSSKFIHIFYWGKMYPKKFRPFPSCSKSFPKKTIAQ
jgi:hypothetical protein